MGIINLSIQFLRWNFVLSLTNYNESKSKIVKSFLIGCSAGLFTPFRIGELFARKLSLERATIGSVITLSIIDKLFLLINILSIGCITAILLLKYYFDLSDYIVGSFFVVYLLLIISIFILVFETKTNHYFLNWLNEITSRKTKFLNIVSELRILSIEARARLLILNFLNYLILIFQFSFLVRAFDNSSSFIKNGISGILMFFSKSFFPQITIGEIGIREGASIFSLSLFGVADYVALNTAFCIFLINILFPAIMGLIVLLIEKLSENGAK